MARCSRLTTSCEHRGPGGDVRYLHRMKEELDRRLVREGRMELAQACFDFLPARAELDLAGWPETDKAA